MIQIVAKNRNPYCQEIDKRIGLFAADRYIRMRTYVFEAATRLRTQAERWSELNLSF